MDVGVKISNLRNNKKLSQLELAHRLGISQTALCDIESGKTKKIDFMLMDKVCKEFEVDFDYFVEKQKVKQVNKDNSVGYLATNQAFNFSEKLIEQYEERIKELKEIIVDLKKSNP
jgi:transcriptional regulator with XRE-family HTH domain